MEIKSKKGFTLIEIVMVLAIIGIISSMIFPNFSTVQTKAKETSLKSTCHTIQVALESYFLTNANYPNGNNLHIADLLTILQNSGELINPPQNPFTNKTFSSSDSSGKITYTYEPETNIYTIIAKGINNQQTIFTLQNI
jgi:prepilin-type N-terminal cleavage/methylation domain-containing protein